MGNSDRSSNVACLVVIYGLELGKKFDLNRPQFIIGRSSKADLQIDQEPISRNHCKIINTGNAIMLCDMGSTNGTYVNDEMIGEYVLRDGDFIKLGRCIFKFLSGNNIDYAYHEEIYRLTTVDGLTQVFNRRYFVETLEREIGRALRYRRDLSLIMFDIDRLKGVNDSFGNLAGDHVLKHLASVIKTRLRNEDVLARYGGEEFAIMLPEIDGDNAMQFAEELRKLVEVAEFKFDEALIPITVSIGVASLRGEIEDVLAFIKTCNDALFAAKESGRNRVVSELNASEFLPNPKITPALGFREAVLRKAGPSTVLVCVGLNSLPQEQLHDDRPRRMARWFQDLIVDICNNCVLGWMDDLILIACPTLPDATMAFRKIRDGIITRSTIKPVPVFVHGLPISLAGADLSQCIAEAASSLPDGAIPRWGFQLPLPLGIPLRSLFLASEAAQRPLLLVQLRDTIVSWLLVWLASELAELHRIGVAPLSAEDQAARFSDDHLARFELLKELVTESAPHSSCLQSSHAWGQLFSEPSALWALARFIDVRPDAQVTNDYWSEFERAMIALLRKFPLISPPVFITRTAHPIERTDDTGLHVPQFSATSELLIGDNAIVPTEMVSFSRPVSTGQLFFFTPNAPPIAMEPFARFERCDSCHWRVRIARARAL